MSLRKSSSENRSEYIKKQRKSIIFLMVMFVVLAVVFLLSLRAGSYDTPVIELIKGVFGKAHDKKINLVIQNNRLPRILTSIVAGSGLGLTGCLLQVVLHNPLASSSTLGVSQGATFGAAMAIIAFGATGTSGWMVPFFSLAGSVIVAFVILGLSKFKQVSAEGIVLAGVAISAMLTGGTTLLQYFADEVALNTLVFWTFGDLGNTDYTEIGVMAVLVVALFVYSLFRRWDYNALLSGDETAISLGINVKRLTLENMIFSCIVCSFIVSHIGLVSFIGLIAPHIVKMFVGNNHVFLIPGSLMAGATILTLGDLVSRTVIMPIILPIGALTSFLGGPIFLYLLFKGRKAVC